MIDRANAIPLRLQGAAEGNGLAVQPHLAAVGCAGPGQYLDQGGFARPILAQQGMNLAAAQVEIHIVQRAMAAENLDDPFGLQDGFCRF